MKKVILNTIIGASESVSQYDFIQEVIDLEIDGFEVRSELFNEDTTKRKEEFGKIKELLTDRGLDLYVSYPVSFFENNGVNPVVRSLIEEAAEYGCEFVKFNIGNIDDIVNVTKAKIDELLTGLDVKVNIENDQTPENGNLKDVLTALDRVVAQELSIGFVYDLGNWEVMNEDPKEAYDKTVDLIKVFHLKNVNSDNQTTLLDDGLVDWKQYTSLNIPYIIEYSMGMDSLPGEIEKLKASF